MKASCLAGTAGSRTGTGTEMLDDILLVRLKLVHMFMVLDEKTWREIGLYL